jgi:NitT/TauT family transport system ATP-binding protein
MTRPLVTVEPGSLEAVASARPASQRLSGAPIAIRGVSKIYPTEKRETVSVSNVEIDIRAGEFVCLLGPSGCGKSTLLNLIAGLDFPTSGEVIVAGKAVTGPGPDRTVMFQDAALFPWLSLRKNIAFPLELAGVRRDEIDARVEKALRMVHLYRFADAPIHTLSGGMRQRGALARALVSEPGTLLMDEPFAALDAQTRDVMYGELEHVWMATGKTVVFVTHNVREAVRLGDRIVVMATRPGRAEGDRSGPAAAEDGRGQERFAPLRRGDERASRRDRASSARGGGRCVGNGSPSWAF